MIRRLFFIGCPRILRSKHLSTISATICRLCDIEEILLDSYLKALTYYYDFVVTNKVYIYYYIIKTEEKEVIIFTQGLEITTLIGGQKNRSRQSIVVSPYYNRNSFGKTGEGTASPRTPRRQGRAQRADGAGR